VGRKRSPAVYALDGSPAEGRTGVTLSFHPRSSRLGLAQIDDWADLGPELSIPAIGGVGKVLRVLRAARIAAPSNPFDLVGRDVIRQRKEFESWYEVLDIERA